MVANQRGHSAEPARVRMNARFRPCNRSVAEAATARIPSARSGTVEVHPLQGGGM